MKEFHYFDLRGNEVNDWFDVPDEPEYPTKHLTREIISQFFEKEKVLRSLSGEERENYIMEYEREIWDYIPLYSDLSLFEENGKWGAKNNVLDIVTLAPIYDEVLWNDGLSTFYYYKVKSGNKYGVVTPDKNGGKLVIPLIYDEIKRLQNCEGIVLGRINQKWYIVRYNEERNNSNELEYDEIIEKERHYNIELRTRRGNKWGVYMNDFIIPPIYDDVFVPEIFGWVRVCKDGEWGYIDVNNEFTLDVSEAYSCYYYYL